jgi:hypothetical protein
MGTEEEGEFMTEGKKKSIFKRWWFWLVVVVVIIAIANTGGKDEPKKVADSQAVSNNKSGNSEPAVPEKTEFKLGESIQLKDNKLTVTKVTKSAGTEFDKPKAGNEFVIVTLTVENAGKENISYNPFDFKMTNSQGQITDAAFTVVNTDTALQSGELAAGGKVSGTIAFEQPKGDSKLQLQYQPSFWSDKTVKVNLQ